MSEYIIIFCKNISLYMAYAMSILYYMFMPRICKGRAILLGSVNHNHIGYFYVIMNTLAEEGEGT
jgi:hypothetical protein